MMLYTWLVNIITTFGALATLYGVSHVVYNLYLHPLAHFPGPTLAAATRYWEHYYTYFYHGGGRFTDILSDLHQKYGSVVRINPFEVHILDRDGHGMYNELFNIKELDKRVYYGSSNLQNSPSKLNIRQGKFGSHSFPERTNPEQFATHRMRRKAWNSFFSKIAIARIEPLIHVTVEKLCDRLRESASADNSATNLSLLFRCMTFDIICDYLLPEGFRLLDDPNRHAGFIKGFLSVFKILGLIQQAPVVAMCILLLRSLPRWMQISPSDTGMIFVKLWQDDLGPKVRDVVNKTSENGTAQIGPSVVEEYLRNTNVPGDEKSEKALRDNVLMFVAAGMETTGAALSMAAFQLASHGDQLAFLRQELDGVWPAGDNVPSWHVFERLPYLTAVIKESLRMSVGVMSHLHRINHHRAMQYKEWTIPPGTSVSMSQVFILYDDEIFPEPKAFRPDRWTQGQKSKELDKSLVVFSQGARHCIGSEMAWAELYITLAAIVRRFEFKLHETNESHVLPTRNFFIPMPEREDGVRVIVEERQIKK